MRIAVDASNREELVHIQSKMKKKKNQREKKPVHMHGAHQKVEYSM